MSDERLPVPSRLEHSSVDRGAASGGGRLEITFDPQRVPSLHDVATGFGALDRLYRRRGAAGTELVLMEVRSGSIVAIVQSVQTFMGAVMPFVGGTNDAVEFGKTLRDTIRALKSPEKGEVSNVSVDDAAEVREVLSPIVNNGGGNLNLRTFRYRDQKREVLAEFNDNDVRQAYDKASAIADVFQTGSATPLTGPASQRFFVEETLVFEQASRAPGKEKGRTGDRGVISSIWPKALPVYFKKSVQGVKERMILSDENPMRYLFIVDGVVTMLD